MQEYAEVWQKLPTVYKKTFKRIGNNSWMSSPGVTFNLTCGKGVTGLQNLTNLRLSSFATSHKMQQKNVDVSPNGIALKKNRFSDDCLVSLCKFSGMVLGMSVTNPSFNGGLSLITSIWRAI